MNRRERRSSGRRAGVKDGRRGDRKDRPRLIRVTIKREGKPLFRWEGTCPEIEDVITDQIELAAASAGMSVMEFRDHALIEVMERGVVARDHELALLHMVACADAETQEQVGPGKEPMRHIDFIRATEGTRYDAEDINYEFELRRLENFNVVLTGRMWSGEASRRQELVV
jgi:hypothetical protein